MSAPSLSSPIRILSRLLAVILVFLTGQSLAQVFPLPDDGNSLVGRVQYVTTRHEDTLLDIARRFDVGFSELVAANPGVDAWLPGEGTTVLVPTAYILPPRPWQGVVVNLAEMRLYYFPEHEAGEHGEVMTFPIGIGREGWSTPLGTFSVVEKIEKPSWTMPLSIADEMAAEGQAVRRSIPPGPDNPLGEFALMLDEPGYLIHGTNKPFSIGMRVSHGCLRLYPEDISVLFSRVPRGTPVRIINESFKIGVADGALFLEAHAPLSEQRNRQGVSLTPLVKQLVEVTARSLPPTEWDKILAVANRYSGVPTPLDVTCEQPACAGRWLQVGAFRAADRARQLAMRLQASQPSVRVLPCDERGWCRVVVGPFRSSEALAAAARAMRENFGVESLVIAAREDAESPTRP